MDFPPFSAGADEDFLFGGVEFHATTRGDTRDSFVRDGKRYVMSRAIVIAHGYSGRGALGDDFSCFFTRLYRTPRGRHFIVVDGFLHPESGGLCFGRGFRAVDNEEARQWWEGCDERDEDAFEVEDA